MFNFHKEVFKNIFNAWKSQCALTTLKPSEKHRPNIDQNFQDLLFCGTDQSAKEPK